MDTSPVDFRTEPQRYKHWRLAFDGPIATLTMDVQEDGGLRPGYELKLNSYDLGVDIELYDAVQRLRFEHPEVAAIMLVSGKERVFCAGANIRMLGQSSHGWKVNFCKFTNETRNAIEEASAESKQAWICVVNGPCAGGGYELAMACQHIVMADDGNTSVALPEVPLLAVLPGTGGLTRLVDKRRVRRDRADVFCTLEEGVKGKRAVEWGFVDEVVPRSRLAETTRQRAQELAARTDRPKGARGIALTPLERTIESARIRYRFVTCEIDRARGRAEITVQGPDTAPPTDVAAIHAAGVGFWPLAVARELDDLILHLRANEEAIGLWVLRTTGDPERVEAHDRLLADHAGDWLVNPPLSQAHAEASRRVVALDLRPDRARLVLHGHAARAGAGRRPLVHAGRPARGRRHAAGYRAAHVDELRRLSDVQRAHAARHAFSRRAGTRRRSQGQDRPGSRGRGGGRGRAGDLHAGRHRLGR